MSSWLRSLRSVIQGQAPALKRRLARLGRRTSGPAITRPRLQLEDLEGRVVPSGGAWWMHNHEMGGDREDHGEMGGDREDSDQKSPSKAQQSTFVQTNLVSDVAGLAQVTDPNLKNPWGVSFSATSPFWISDQGTNDSTLYAVKVVNGLPVVTVNSLVVAIPTKATPPNGPTGQVQNNTTSFHVGANPAAFIFANLNGQISAWNGGTTATVEATGATGSVYTGLAIGSNGSANFLYAANDALGRIDVYDGSFAPVTLGTGAFGTFIDPKLPAGKNLVPFNVQNIGGSIYVTYAPAGHTAQTMATEGQGAVAVFDTTGHFIEQLISGSKLASPWGITLAPAGFGSFGGDLLVGNFAYKVSEINAFDPKTGKFLGTLTDANGNKILNPGLWALTFGNGGNGGDPNTLYFTAGINNETDGLFGQIQAAPTLAKGAPVVTSLPTAVEQSFTTVPANGDQNPSGVAFVPKDIKSGGLLQPGDILVSDFNNKADLKGTGSTIVRVTPSGERSVFFQGTTSLGLTGALGVLKSGFVIAGSVPTTDGTFATVKPGALLILDSNGKLVTTLTDSKLLDGPWGLTINDEGSDVQVFVSNVLSGTVTRIDLEIPKTGAPVVESMTQIASGYMHGANAMTLAVGPAGLAYDARKDILYVASTDDNAIYAIADAGDTTKDNGKGKLIYQDAVHLHGPVGLVLAPNGDLIAANSDAVNADPTQPSELVEFTKQGKFVGQFSIDPKTGGAFGMSLASVDGSLRIAAVNDNTDTLDVFTLAMASPLRAKKHHGEGDSDDD
jgi:uncharacterized protein (TIGR03118 family)